jgi:hypothetical protein
MKAIAFFLLAFTASVPSFALDDTNGDGYVSLLVPIALSNSLQRVPGAHGTLWTTDLWFRNGSTYGFNNLQPPAICMPACPVGAPAGYTGPLSGIETNNGFGAMLHVPAPASGGFEVTARLLELSRQSQPTGVEIPVIGEGQFFTSERWLLAVPSSPQVRSALRVWDPRAKEGTTLFVDFIGADGTVLASTMLRPGDDPKIQHPGPSPSKVPTVAASLDLTSEFPVLQEQEHFHVRIRPAQEGREYWAMVSVTHNVTQHVLLITAQP